MIFLIKSPLYKLFNQIYCHIDQTLKSILESDDTIEKIKINNAILIQQFYNLKYNLEQHNLHYNVRDRFFFAIIAMYDRMILDILLERKLLTQMRKSDYRLIFFEAYFYETLDSGNILFKDIENAIKHNNKEMLFIYLKILCFFYEHNTDDSINLRKVKSNIFEIIFGDPTMTLNNRDLANQKIQHYNSNYKNIVYILGIIYLFLSSAIWYANIRNIHKEINCIMDKEES